VTRHLDRVRTSRRYREPLTCLTECRLAPERAAARRPVPRLAPTGTAAPSPQSSGHRRARQLGNLRAADSPCCRRPYRPRQPKTSAF